MVKVEDIPVEKCRNAVKGLLNSQNKSWVLFKNQTFVILQEGQHTKESASETATEMMKKFGPVYPGCPAGDFNVLETKDNNGWIVTGHCDDMFTFVDEGQAKKEDGIMVIGLVGRGMRNQDGINPEIVHVELASN